MIDSCLDVYHAVIFSLCSHGGNMFMLDRASFDVAQTKVRIRPQSFLLIIFSLSSSLFDSWKSSMHLLIFLKTVFGDLSSKLSAVCHRNGGSMMKGKLLNFCGLFVGGSRSLTSSFGVRVVNFDTIGVSISISEVRLVLSRWTGIALSFCPSKATMTGSGFHVVLPILDKLWNSWIFLVDFE